MALIEQPPYAPQRGSAECLIEEIRHAVEGRVNATLDVKVAAADAFLTELDRPHRSPGSSGAFAWAEGE